MKVSQNRLASCALAIASIAIPSFASAAPLFTSNGDSFSGLIIQKDTSGVAGTNDSSATVVDYGALGIPEAPGSLGGAASTGIQLIANKGDATGAFAGLNIQIGDTSPTVFSGVHTLQFYVWMNVPTGATGSTEMFSAGLVRSETSALPIYNQFRTGRGNGAWFLMSGDNGNALDYRHYDQGVAATSITLDGGGTVLKPILDSITTADANTAAGDFANEWVKVDLVNDPINGKSYVYWDNVLVTTNNSTSLTGTAWFGYEDGGGVGIGTTGLAGYFDNIRIIEGNAVPEPSSLALALPAVALLTRRRRA